MKYYNTSQIDRKNCVYNIIFGERSNGKTYAVLLKALKSYFKTGMEFAIVRRWKDDIAPKNASRFFEGIIANGELSKISNGKYETVVYRQGKWYLANFNDEGKAIYGDNDVVGYAFSISDVEHTKSTSYPNVNLIIFDEFIATKVYLKDEFVSFANIISTIARRRDDVKIYMLGNTVDTSCPYFAEMGLDKIKVQKQGTIDVYTYGQSQLTVAVEYCAPTNTDRNSASHKYFAFNNPKLEMITGGAWAIDIYPHLPEKYKPSNVVFTYFIDFNCDLFQCEVIDLGDKTFTYIHIKTTPLQNPDHDLVYSLDFTAKPNYNRNLLKPTRKLHRKILSYFQDDLVCYQDNSVGNAIHNYLKACKRS